MLLKKGQISVELLIVILFLIAFIYVYNTLAEQTVYSLELTKIKEQEQDIVLSLNEFIQLQKNIIYDNNITYESKYKIPEIAIASKRVPCKINISSSGYQIDVNSDWIVSYNLNTELPASKFTISTFFMCGQEISCIKYDGKIKCE